MTYQELKDFCNKLTADQLTQDVYVAREEEAVRVLCGDVSEEDMYYVDGDAVGTLEDFKETDPDWEDSDFTIVPKGTVRLHEDF